MTTIDTSTTSPAVAPAGPAGRRLAVGAALFAAGVALEWVLNPQHSDGTVEHPVRFTLCVGTSIVGAALMSWALRDLRRGLGADRAVRFGRVAALVGTTLLLVSAVAVLVTGLAAGAPAVLSFIPWALGMLALSVGPVVLGLGLLRRRRGLAVGVLLAGLAAFASIAIPLDPWHDISLVVMCAAWAVVGSLLRR